MKIRFGKQACLGMGLIFMTSQLSYSQERFEATVGADLVSNYIWRGQDCGGVSFQPSITIARSGLSLTAWGSTGFDKKDTKELDFTLDYTIKGFNIALTDYYLREYKTDNSNYFNYSAHSTAHICEVTLGYDFGPVNVNWNTYFAGDDYTKANGKRAYSSYFEITAPFTLGGIDFNAEIGATPWEGDYTAGSDKFAIVNIGIEAAKEIKITEYFNLPVFAKVTFNPRIEAAYFAFGISL